MPAANTTIDGFGITDTSGGGHAAVLRIAGLA